MREISSQMMGRFSSPEHALLQGRNTSAGGVPQSTASFKLNMQQNSSVLKSSNARDDTEIMMDTKDDY